MGIITSILLYIASFIAIWWGAGLIISAIDKVAKKLKLSCFAMSFFVLGILTSIPEMAVSVRAISENNPSVFVGTLLGGIVVMFLFIIPVLAILGKGIKINHDLDKKTLLLILSILVLPSLLIIDHRITNIEGLLLIFFYLVVLYVVQKKHGIFDKEHIDLMQFKAYTFIDLLKIIIGIIVVLISSNFIFEQTLVFSSLLDMPPFYVSLIALGLGTNLPEMSIAIRAVLSNKKDVAFGDYLGSGVANVLLLGLFTLINGGEVLTVNNFFPLFLFVVLGLGLFFYFAQSKKDISAKEGYMLLVLYVIFVIYEFWRGLV